MTRPTVWKYELPESVSVLDLPESAVVLHVDVQHGAVCCWVQLDPSEPTRPITVEIVATGSRPPLGGRHVNTFLADDGNYVFHAYVHPAVRS